MHVFGNTMKSMFKDMMEWRPDVAQEYLDKLEAINWKNYLSKKEAVTIVNGMEPSGGWDVSEWERCMENMDFRTEDTPYYNKWAMYDKVTHTISGVLTAYVSLLFIPERSEKLWFNVLFIIAFSWMCAGLWETFEFVCDTFFNGDAQRVAATGVTDTMTDMLVAFAGASVFSFGYYIKNKCKK